VSPVELDTLGEAPVRGEHTFTPRGAAKAAMLDRSPELLLSGPAGTGKSRACLEKVHTMCALNPGMRALLVRKVRDTLTTTGLVTYREHVAAEAISSGMVTWYGGSAAEPPQWRYWNGSKIMIGGMDKPTKIMSSEYDMVYVQEAIELTERDWENITTRLRNGKVSFQQLIADTNPDVPTHWLKVRVERGVTKMLETQHEDNPILCSEDGTLTKVGADYLSKLDNLTGVVKDRLRHGRWIAAEGQVYESYDRAIHQKAIVNPPHDWERIWSIDFGYTNPFVLQCWAIDGDGRAHLYRELYRTQRLVEDHASDILKIVRKADGTWREPKPKVVICDHDAEDRATLERYLDLGTAPAHKSVSDGIQAVQQRLKVAADGKPRIFFSPTAVVEVDPLLEARKLPTSTLEEIPGYVWDRPREGTIAAERPPKETPKKANDHGLDAARYLIAYLDLAPQPGIRWL
jgi:PBSX family phage terminase large subunit